MTFTFSVHIMRGMRKKPPPQFVLEELHPFLVETYRILDTAASSSARDFERRKRKPEIFHFASGLRNEAKSLFEELSNLGAFPCEVIDLHLNGLQVVHREYAIRIRKATRKDGARSTAENSRSASKDGVIDLEAYGLPKARKGSALDDYYGQQSLTLVWPSGVKVPDDDRSALNLVILWMPDRALSCLEGAIIAEPGRGQSIMWWRPLPHPLTYQNSATSPEFSVDDLEYELNEREEDEKEEEGN